MQEKANNWILNVNSFDGTEDSLKKSTNDPLINIHNNFKSEHKNRNTETPTSNYNHGRWTSQEHQLFLEAIFLYGNEWKKVQQHIKTRNSTQARSHAQKFFINIRKRLSYKDISCLIRDKDSYKSAVEYDWLRRLFKDFIPNNKTKDLDKDKLIRLLINLKNFQKKRKFPGNIEGSTEYNIYSDSNEMNCNNSYKKKIFLIAKDKFKMKNTINNVNQEYNNFSDLTYKKRSKTNKDSFIKLKRNLEENHTNNFSDQFKSKNYFSFDESQAFLSNFPELQVQSNLHISGKDVEFKSDLSNYLSRNSLFNDFNEIEVGCNKILNDVDFQRNAIVGEEFKFNMLNYCENENVNNFFELYVHKSEIQEN